MRARLPTCVIHTDDGPNACRGIGRKSSIHARKIRQSDRLCNDGLVACLLQGFIVTPQRYAPLGQITEPSLTKPMFEVAISEICSTGTQEEDVIEPIALRRTSSMHSTEQAEVFCGRQFPLIRRRL